MGDTCNEMKMNLHSIIYYCVVSNTPAFKVVFLEDEMNMLTSGVTVNSFNLYAFPVMLIVTRAVFVVLHFAIEVKLSLSVVVVVYQQKTINSANKLLNKIKTKTINPYHHSSFNVCIYIDVITNTYTSEISVGVFRLF